MSQKTDEDDGNEASLIYVKVPECHLRASEPVACSLQRLQGRDLWYHHYSFGHASPKTSPSSPTTTATSNRPRTPSISKRGARSELPYTPAFITPSTSGGSGKQRVLVSLLLRTVELHDLESLYGQFFPLPRRWSATEMRETVNGRESVRPVCAPIVDWTFCPCSQIPKPAVTISLS
ncbi:conserved hypothetical protein [Trichinella spiralis]|uniref:hypothetical protein n=1 Tax=Trichinella spiralis TaxID=6334 RepID=UPI0001EFF032|nr:conserved hypothetical protein [Trichinella spiralis]